MTEIMNDEDKTDPIDNGVDNGVDNGPDNADETSIEERLAEVERKAGEFRDQMLRARAELENTRKRTDQEIMRVRKYALEAFALELLEVKDNLERGLGDDAGDDAGDDTGDDTGGRTVESVSEGLRLTLKSLEQVFGKFGIEEVSPAGQVFDPELHQAMSMFETGEYEPNTVVEVSQKGYLLSGRLLRPAMVVVAAKPTAAGDDAGDDAGGKA